MANVIDALLITLGFDTKGLTKGADEAKSALKGTSEGTTRAGRDMEVAARKMTEAFRTVRNEILGLFALVTAGRGIKQMVSDITAGDAQLGRFSKQVGMTTEELSAWQQAVIRSGGSAEGFASSVQSLTNAYQQQGITGINPLVAYYRTLGVAMVDSQGKMKPVTEQFREFAAYIQDHHLSGPQASALFGNMGIDQGTINLLMQGQKGVDELVKRMKSLGVVHEEDAKNAQRLQNNLSDLKQGFDSLVRTVINDLSPMVIEIMKHMSDWLSVNREWLAQKIDEYLKGFVGFLKEVPGNLKAFADGIKPIVDALGGWVRVTEILFGLWAATKVIGLIASISRVGAALGVARTGTIGGALSGAAVGVGALELGSWAYNKVQEQHVAAGGKAQTVEEGGVVKWIADILSGKGDNGFRKKEDTGFNSTERNDLYQRFLQFQADLIRATKDAKVQAMNDNDMATANNALGSSRSQGALGAHPQAGQAVNTSAGSREAYKFWMDNGFTSAGAAAMVAQEQQESGFNPAARGDKVAGVYTAAGSFQWHKDRRDRILAATGIDVTTASAAEQRRAMLLEMKMGLDKGAGGAYLPIKNATSAYTAGAIASSQIERPGDKMGEAIRRGALAQKTQQFHDGNPNAMNTISPFSPAAAKPAPGPRSDSSSNTSTTNIGAVNIQSGATNADDLSRDINKALVRRLTPIQANSGLR